MKKKKKKKNKEQNICTEATTTTKVIINQRGDKENCKDAESSTLYKKIFHYNFVHILKTEAKKKNFFFPNY